jgi:hypothetical protein
VKLIGVCSFVHDTGPTIFKSPLKGASVINLVVNLLLGAAIGSYFKKTWQLFLAGIGGGIAAAIALLTLSSILHSQPIGNVLSVEAIIDNWIFNSLVILITSFLVRHRLRRGYER